MEIIFHFLTLAPGKLEDKIRFIREDVLKPHAAQLAAYLYGPVAIEAQIQNDPSISPEAAYSLRYVETLEGLLNMYHGHGKPEWLTKEVESTPIPVPDQSQLPEPQQSEPADEIKVGLV